MMYKAALPFLVCLVLAFPASASPLADSDGDGCISSPELSTFIYYWHLNSSDPTIGQLIGAIGAWKAGCHPASPSVPQNLAATAVSSSQINLTWSPPAGTAGSDLAGYLIYRGGIRITPIPIAATSYLDTGLDANTTYAYQVSAVDNASNESALSSAVSAATHAFQDTSPPSVSITSPVSGTTYSSAQTVMITASASDDVGITKVEFYGGATLMGTATAAPFAYSWNISSDNNGANSWTARAYDAAGNSRLSSAVSLTVNVSVPILKSDYFMGDAVSERIASGELMYDMNQYGFVCGEIPARLDEYGFEILNAIKQLGYLKRMPINCRISGLKTPILILNDFQRLNGLTQSDFVDDQTILRLDSLLVESESRDRTANAFTCYDHIKNAPPNDASKDHLSLVYSTALNAFPQSLRIGEPQCLNSQTFNGRICTGNEIEICDPWYWPSYYENGTLRGDAYAYSPDGQDDYSVVYTMIHEQAHYVDLNGLIDTSSFYNISFDYSTGTRDPPSYWLFLKPRMNISNEDLVRQNFFSYSLAWESPVHPGYYTAQEDFANCVEMYIIHGVVFRDYMNDKPPLAAKYQWIKQNIFNGKEFNTGDPNYKSYAPDLLYIGYGIGDPGGIGELRPDYIFDYMIA